MLEQTFLVAPNLNEVLAVTIVTNKLWRIHFENNNRVVIVHAGFLVLVGPVLLIGEHLHNFKELLGVHLAAKLMEIVVS